MTAIGARTQILNLEARVLSWNEKEICISFRDPVVGKRVGGGLRLEPEGSIRIWSPEGRFLLWAQQLEELFLR